MKSGASDPFDDAGDLDAATDDAANAEAAEEVATRSDADQTVTGGSTTSDRSGANSDRGTAKTRAGHESGGLSRDDLPYVLRRERVKDERPEVHQLFVQASTHENAINTERDLTDRLDADLARTDAREAIYLAGMDHLDEAEAILREWGYDL